MWLAIPVFIEYFIFEQICATPSSIEFHVQMFEMHVKNWICWWKLIEFFVEIIYFHIYSNSSPMSSNKVLKVLLRDYHQKLWLSFIVSSLIVLNSISSEWKRVETINFPLVLLRWFLFFSFLRFFGRAGGGRVWKLLEIHSTSLKKEKSFNNTLTWPSINSNTLWQPLKVQNFFEFEIPIFFSPTS